MEPLHPEAQRQQCREGGTSEWQEWDQVLLHWQAGWDQVLLHWQAGGDYGYTRAVHQAVTTLLQQVRQG